MELIRPYYHSRTGVPIHPNEDDYDSDDDIDVSWIVASRSEILRNFTDISEEEKELMLLWNHFVHDFRVYADYVVPRAVLAFARTHGPRILSHGLRHVWLLHIMVLWEYGVLPARFLLVAMRIVDSFRETEARLAGDAGDADDADDADDAEGR